MPTTRGPCSGYTIHRQWLCLPPEVSTEGTMHAQQRRKVRSHIRGTQTVYGKDIEHLLDKETMLRWAM